MQHAMTLSEIRSLSKAISPMQRSEVSILHKVLLNPHRTINPTESVGGRATRSRFSGTGCWSCPDQGWGSRPAETVKPLMEQGRY